MAVGIIRYANGHMISKRSFLTLREQSHIYRCLSYRYYVWISKTDPKAMPFPHTSATLRLITEFSPYNKAIWHKIIKFASSSQVYGLG